MLPTKIFIPLNEDLLFKEAICHIDNRKQLIYYLRVTTGLGEEIITNNLRVKYESVLEKTKYKDKSMRGDVIIEFDKYKINLESYSYFDNHSFDKSTSYIMRIFSTQLERGKNYDTLESVIQINLIDNVTIPFDDNMVSNYYLTNASNLEDKKLADKFMIKYYRIDKVRNIPYNELTEEMRWIRFIGATTPEERKRVAEGDELLMEFDNWIEEYVNDEKTKKIFGEWGEHIALNKGIKQGIEKGEQKRELEIAKKMLQKGSDLKFISEITDLPIEIIENLKTETKE